MTSKQDAAVVLFSGGQDSTTCLFWAKKRYQRVVAIQFDYGQRHRIELIQGQYIAQFADTERIVLPINTFTALNNNSLVNNELQIHSDSEDQLPNTFVPGRNLLFLTLAAAWAYSNNIFTLIGGMCQTDYSGYPDCREDFIRAAQSAISLALGADMTLETPLMFLSKAQIWQLADELNCLELIREHTHTCYNGDRTHRWSWGFGCGECPACALRAKGYQEAYCTKN